MLYVLSDEGLQALRDLLRLRPLMAFDFDGTLAPMSDAPDDVRTTPLMAQRLAQLAQRWPTAVITGRGVADVTGRLGFEPRYVVGSHGAEEAGQSGPILAPDALDALQRLRARLARSQDRLSALGVRVEDKSYCLALHYRLAADPKAACAAIEAELHALDPALETFGGKCVVNVVAAGAPDKGDAVTALMRRSGAGTALFVGDDINDEAVFERARPHWVTVRVGQSDLSRARFFVHEQADVAVLLERLMDLASDPTP